MKICMAQIRPSAGQVKANVDEHVDFAGHANELGAEMIVFPELSITGYEPKLAENLAMDAFDPRLDPIKAASATLSITISAGLPLKTTGLPRIGMATFFPNGEIQLYAKQKLHSDELSFFTSGAEPTVLRVNGTRITPGICYETCFNEPFQQAKSMCADVYLASVAKPLANIVDAYEHYAKVAKQFSIVTVLSNCVGPADNFTCCGRSAAWDTRGNLLASMGENETGLLLVDIAEGSAMCFKI